MDAPARRRACCHLGGRRPRVDCAAQTHSPAAIRAVAQHVDLVRDAAASPRLAWTCVVERSARSMGRAIDHREACRLRRCSRTLTSRHAHLGARPRDSLLVRCRFTDARSKCGRGTEARFTDCVFAGKWEANFTAGNQWRPRLRGHGFTDSEWAQPCAAGTTLDHHRSASDSATRCTG